MHMVHLKTLIQLTTRVPSVSGSGWTGFIEDKKGKRRPRRVMKAERADHRFVPCREPGPIIARTTSSRKKNLMAYSHPGSAKKSCSSILSYSQGSSDAEYVNSMAGHVDG